VGEAVRAAAEAATSSAGCFGIDAKLARMTLFLASVRNVAEAEIARFGGADVIDLKEPARGALGAVRTETIGAVVRRVAGSLPVSATVGDLPMQAELVAQRVAEVAAQGVDYVKLGVLPNDNAESCIARLEELPLVSRVILVLFADRLPNFDAVATAAATGAAGLMLDTAGKDGRALPDYLPLKDLARFVAGARRRGLAVGLAGSLRHEHVPELLTLRPDLLGFRGALCRGGSRGEALDPAACRALRALVPRAKTGLKRPSHPVSTAFARRSVVLKGNGAPPLTSLRRAAMNDDALRESTSVEIGQAAAQAHDRVFVHDLVLDVEIGVYRHEKGVTQRVRFSVDVDVLPPSVAVDDKIERVFDYDMIIDAIKSIVARGHIHLVETLAEEAAQQCLALPRAARVKVKIEKLNKEPGAVGVEIERVREGLA
jgi:dihydroneopterin aldolase